MLFAILVLDVFQVSVVIGKHKLFRTKPFSHSMNIILTSKHTRPPLGVSINVLM